MRGIILAALGIEQSLAHLGSRHVGTLGSWALGCGLALAVVADVLIASGVADRVTRAPQTAAAHR